jgi:hypothetical protein
MSNAFFGFGIALTIAEIFGYIGQITEFPFENVLNNLNRLFDLSTSSPTAVL